MERRANNKIVYKGTRWRKYHNVLVSDEVPHREIHLSASDAKFLLKKTGAYFIRWTSDFDSKLQYPFWWVIKDEREDESLKSYSAKIRSEIRRGLKNCEVFLLPHGDVDEELLKLLYNVYSEAFKRYVNMYSQPVRWDIYKKNISKDIHDVNKDFWVVVERNGNIPIAYAQTIKKENTVSYNVIKLHPDFLKLYPSYALVLEMNKYYLNERNFLYVHDGVRSIGHETNIHDWLIRKFKFRKAYTKLNIWYREDIKLIVNALFGIRKFIYKTSNFPLFKKIAVLLKHEEIRRECDKIYKFNSIRTIK